MTGWTVAIVVCRLCGGTGERRILGRPPMDDPANTDRMHRSITCPRCDGAGQVPAVVKVP